MAGEAPLLTPRALVDDFGLRSDFAAGLVPRLFRPPGVRIGSPGGDAKAEAWLGATVQRFRIPLEDGSAQAVGSALERYYALICRFLALRAIERPEAESPLARLATAGPRAFPRILRLALSPAPFEARGIAGAMELRLPGGWSEDGDGTGMALLRELARRLLAYRAGPGTDGPVDLLQRLQHDLIPAETRRSHGVFFTPDWLADRVVESTLGDRSPEGLRILDPSCGSGAFLLAAARWIRRRADPGRALALLTETLAGWDLDPVAVASAWTNLLLGSAELLLTALGPVRFDLRTADLLGTRIESLPFDVIVGNPPWVNLENMDRTARDAFLAHGRAVGLLADSGANAILGRSKKDLSLLVTLRVADWYLAPRGRLGFVLPQSAFKGVGAGRGFRRFRLPDGTPFGPERMDDFAALRPFPDAANRTVAAVFVKGEAVRFPVPCRIWSVRDSARAAAAEPVDPGDPASPWVVAGAAALAAIRRAAGACAHTVRQGVNTGGANGVFWVEASEGAEPGTVRVASFVAGSRKQLRRVEREVEPDLLVPLLRGRDVARWRAAPSLQLLLSQDPERRAPIPAERMAAEYPRTLAYLAEFAAVLRARKSRIVRRLMDGGAYWAQFGVGPEVRSPWKVVWREVAHELDAAVVGLASAGGRQKPVAPDHTCVYIPCAGEDGAHFLCALLNAAPARLRVRASITLHPDPHVVRGLALPIFEAGDAAHAELAMLSREAHTAAREGADPAPLEERMDALAAGIWGISAAELAAIRLELRG